MRLTYRGLKPSTGTAVMERGWQRKSDPTYQTQTYLSPCAGLHVKTREKFGGIFGLNEEDEEASQRR